MQRDKTESYKSKLIMSFDLLFAYLSRRNEEFVFDKIKSFAFAYKTREKKETGEVCCIFQY